MLQFIPFEDDWDALERLRIQHDAALFLPAAVVGHFLAPMNAIERILLAISGIVLIAPSWQADVTALIIAVPALAFQIVKRRNAPPQPAQA